MSDEFQVLFNIIVAIAGAFGGIILTLILSSLKELRKTDAELGKEVQALAVSLPSNYVAKPEMSSLADALFKKLDRIEDKLDGKVDKPTNGHTP